MLLYRNHCYDRSVWRQYMQICFLTQQNSSDSVDRPFFIKVAPGLVEFDSDHDAFSFQQLAEDISDLFQQAVLPIK